MNTAGAPAAAPGDRAALWEDFLDIYYAPRQVFARRSAGRWGLVLLLLTLVMGGLFYASQGVMTPILEAEFERAMQGSPDLSAEQMEQARQVSGVFGMIGFVVAFPLSVLLIGVVLWGVGKLFGSVATLSAAFLIATYAQFPRVLQQVLTLVQGLVMDVGDLRSMYSVSLSPARFLDPDAVSPVLLGLAGRLDLFVLWSTLLLAIGLQVLGRLPRAQAYAAAAVVWLLGALPVLAGAIGGAA